VVRESGSRDSGPRTPNFANPMAMVKKEEPEDFDEEKFARLSRYSYIFMYVPSQIEVVFVTHINKPKLRHFLEPMPQQAVDPNDNPRATTNLRSRPVSRTALRSRIDQETPSWKALKKKIKELEKDGNRTQIYAYLQKLEAHETRYLYRGPDLPLDLQFDEAGAYMRTYICTPPILQPFSLLYLLDTHTR